MQTRVNSNIAGKFSRCLSPIVTKLLTCCHVGQTLMLGGENPTILSYIIHKEFLGMLIGLVTMEVRGCLFWYVAWRASHSSEGLPLPNMSQLCSHLLYYVLCCWICNTKVIERKTKNYPRSLDKTFIAHRFDCYFQALPLVDKSLQRLIDYWLDLCVL